MFEFFVPDDFCEEPPKKSNLSAWRERYEAVLRSPRWLALRARLIRECDRRCQRCNRKSDPLQLHHRTYERLGEERDEDVEVLCLECHRKADEQRSANSQARSSDRRYEGRMNGWAVKRFGADWGDRGDADMIAEEFHDWHERRND